LRSSVYFLRQRKNLGKSSALQSGGGVWTKIVFAEVRDLTHGHTYKFKNSSIDTLNVADFRIEGAFEVIADCV